MPAEETTIPVTGMEVIYRGLGREHKPGDDEDRTLIDAIYTLFEEYRNDYYNKEWQRLDDNVKVYEGKYWTNDAEVERGDRKPRMATPIITSCIENIKADLLDEMPEVIFEPDQVGTSPDVTAKVLTKVIEQELDASDWEGEYMKGVQDYLQDGWCVLEAGHDPLANNGLGGAFIRRITNKNFMCDPQTPNLQDGRACFVLDVKSRDWLRQHYPDRYPFMDGDDGLNVQADRIESTTTPNESVSSVFRVIEMWVKEYDPERRRTAVHFIRVAGHQILEDSAIDYPDGYYSLGAYPFHVASLYPQKGSALGLGICDLFKDPQRYADKLDAILLENAIRARNPRMAINDNLVDYDDAKDYSKEVIRTKGSAAEAIQWLQTQPLPAYLMNYSQLIKQSIKDEAGSNDQSRGQTAGGVTAASAITALQDMSTKRSRMEGRELQRAFKECVRMVVEILREKEIVPRTIPITIGGEVKKVPFDRRALYWMDDQGRQIPVEAFVKIKTSRQTRFSKMAHNELVLQFLNLFQGTADPLLMMEALEMDNKEALLEQIRKAQSGGMLALQRQNAEMQQQLQIMGEQLKQYQGAMAQIQQGMMQTPGEGQAASAEGFDAGAVARNMA